MTGHDDTGLGPNRTSRRNILAMTGATGVGVLAGCLGGGGSATGGGDDTSDSGDGGDSDAGSMGDESEAAWRTTELRDVLTDETFSIDGLAGPVAIQSFAVWCPKCQRQSEELSKLGESVTVVGLNIDPNEDAAQVRQHAKDNGFNWRFAVAPTEMTESLVEAFGSTVTNAPSTPIIVACDGGGVEFFSGSQQSADQIRSAASEC